VTTAKSNPQLEVEQETSLLQDTWMHSVLLALPAELSVLTLHSGVTPWPSRPGGRDP